MVLKESSKGGSVGFRFKVTQHIRDAELLKSLVNYLGCGKYSIRPLRPMYGDYLVTKLGDIKDKIIPFFDKYPVQGVKFYDFSALKSVMLLRENNNALTKEALAKIQLIKSGMNKGRIEVSNEDSQVHPLVPFTESKTKKTLRSPSTRHSSQVPLSEKKRHYSSTSIFYQEGFNTPACEARHQIKFNQWLAGLIDGDGEFKTTKKGFSSFKIIMSIKDKSPLYLIKHKYGGSIKDIAGSNRLKYKLQNPTPPRLGFPSFGVGVSPPRGKGLINLINDVNGLIRNPIRMLQLHRICEKYNLKLIEPLTLTYNNG